MLHAWWGLNDFFHDLCERLAGSGFVAFAPDLYHGRIAATIEEAERLRDELKPRQARADTLAALDYLRGLEAAAGPTLGVIGFSLGVYFALGLSRERPEDVRALVAFYGTRSGSYASARAAYLGHFAENDEWEPASGVQRLEKRLRADGRPATFYTYPGTSHWFFEKDRADAYDAQAAELAWQRTVAFLRETLTQDVT